MPEIEAFLRDVDAQWRLASAAPITLRLLGSTALLLQTDYVRGTKDCDVLETSEIATTAGPALVALAGRGSSLHERHRMFLEILRPGFPFLPEEPLWHAIAPFSLPLHHFRIEVLDVVDVVVAKLARYHRTDQNDIAAMVERGLVDPARLVARFRSAVERWSLDARADDLPRIVAHLHRVERDDLLVEESEIELPSWISED